MMNVVTFPAFHEVDTGGVLGRTMASLEPLCSGIFLPLQLGQLHVLDD